MMKGKELKILSEQQEQHPFSQNCIRSNLAQSKRIRASSVWHILIQRNDSRSAVSWNDAGMNNADSKWVINMHFMFINLSSDTSLGAFSRLCLLILKKACQKVCSLGSSLSCRESALQHLHNPQYKISVSSPASFTFYILRNWCLGPSHITHPNLPFKILLSADWCFPLILLFPAISCLSLPSPLPFSFSLLSQHSFFFTIFFCQASHLLSLLNCSLLTNTPTKSVDCLWSVCHIKDNFNVKHICILNHKLRAYEVTMLITMVFLLEFFKMLDASQCLKFSLKILLELLS